LSRVGKETINQSFRGGFKGSQKRLAAISAEIVINGDQNMDEKRGRSTNEEARKKKSKFAGGRAWERHIGQFKKCAVNTKK